MTAIEFLILASIVGGWISSPMFLPLYLTARKRVGENKYAKLVVNYLHTYMAALILLTMVGFIYFILDNVYSGMLIYPAH